MKTFGRVAWLVAGYLLLALASGASPRTSRSSVALGQTVNTHNCVSDITNLTVAWNAFDLNLNRRNPQASTGSLMVDGAYDYEGGRTENDDPRDTINSIYFSCIMNVIYVVGHQKAIATINLGSDETNQFILSGIQKLPDEAAQSYNFTGAQLMSLIIQRVLETVDDVDSIPGNQFNTNLSVEYFMSSQCQFGGNMVAHDSADVQPGLFRLRKGNGTISGTDPDPGYTHDDQ